MKSVVCFWYMATGEGNRYKIKFTDDSRVSDEDVVEEFKRDLDPYFHVGIEVLPLDEIKGNKFWSSVIQDIAPGLWTYIDGDRNFRYSINLEQYVNFS